MTAKPTASRKEKHGPNAWRILRLALTLVVLAAGAMIMAAGANAAMPAAQSTVLDPLETETSTATATQISGPVLLGHVLFTGRGSAPNVAWSVPTTVTMRLAGNALGTTYYTHTDDSGYVTTTVPTSGSYEYFITSQSMLGNGGSTMISAASNVVEMGLLRPGDVDGNNVVNAADFNDLKNSFGKSVGNEGYDFRADLNADEMVNSQDFNLLRTYFGSMGDTPIPTAMPTGTPTSEVTSTATNTTEPTGTATSTSTLTSTPTSSPTTLILPAFAEITTKPYGIPGVVNELNLIVWGRDSYRRGGDAYSPMYGLGGPPGLTPNPEYAKQPYGYLFRVAVPPDYTSDHLLVELFDPDSYNRTGTPPAWPTCSPAPCTTPTPTADQYVSCTSPGGGTCTSSGANYDTGMKLNAYPNGRPAFWRVDEIRSPYTDTAGIRGVYNSGYATTAQFTLWHFDPHASNVYANPATISDQPNGAYLARYTVGWDSYPDLSWYRPTAFDITLRDRSGADMFERDAGGGFSFYLYVQGTLGSSENNYDIRVGPPELNSGGCSTPCSVNQLNLDGGHDWQDGGAKVYAKRSLPLNSTTPSNFPFVLTQVSSIYAGQMLGMRHFDQDCNHGCGSAMQYQMLKCVPSGNTYVPCSPFTDPSCWANISVGYVGDNDHWVAPPGGPFPNGYPDPEPIPIPAPGTPLYTTFFGPSGQCRASWLRIETNPTYSGDSTTWEMPFVGQLRGRR